MLDEPNKKNWLPTVLLVVVVILGIAALLVLFYPGFKRQSQQDATTVEKQTASEALVPADAKSPEEFMQKVQEKSQEIQKNYDSNLTEFAQKEWERIFKDVNGIDTNSFNSGINIGSSKIEKTDDQSTLFRVKYSLKIGEDEVEAEDFFYLILSEAKKKEFGLESVRSETFLTETDIKNNISNVGFAKITKIQK